MDKFRYLFCVALIAVCGCQWTNPQPVEPVQPELRPTPIHVDAGDCARDYLCKLADAFEAASKRYESDADESQIVEDLGNDQAAARLRAFAPIVSAVDSVPGDSPAARRKAKAALMAQFAEQLRGVK